MEEKIYKTLLLKESNNTYMSHSHSLIPENSGMYSVEWNKPLPEDIDSVQYKYENGELIKL